MFVNIVKNETNEQPAMTCSGSYHFCQISASVPAGLLVVRHTCSSKLDQHDSVTASKKYL